MKIPGFNAGASLNRAAGHYFTQRAPYATNRSLVQPAINYGCYSRCPQTGRLQECVQRGRSGRRVLTQTGQGACAGNARALKLLTKTLKRRT